MEVLFVRMNCLRVKVRRRRKMMMMKKKKRRKRKMRLRDMAISQPKDHAVTL